MESWLRSIDQGMRGLAMCHATVEAKLLATLTAIDRRIKAMENRKLTLEARILEHLFGRPEPEMIGVSVEAQPGPARYRMGGLRIRHLMMTSNSFNG